MAQVNVEIDRFSGPLGLLLHLIRQEEMDIFDINIQQITKQYLESIKQMKKLNLEGAGEFIAMAATLIQIKSKMLLPQYNEQGEIVETEDPRRDLVRRLLEYQIYQDAGQKLYRMPLLNRDVWARGDFEEIAVPESDIVLEEGNALFALISAYRNAVKNIKKAVHKVSTALQSISDRIWDMREKLIVGVQTRFSELVAINPQGYTDRKGQVLITFLSLLEMAKIGLVNLFQNDNFSEIHVDTLKEISRDMISNVENYEAANNLGAPLDLVVDAVDMQAADAEEAQAAAAEVAQLSFDETDTAGAGATVALGAFDADVLPIEESASDDDILAEEMRLLADETTTEILEQTAHNENWSDFVTERSTDGKEEEPKEI